MNALLDAYVQRALDGMTDGQIRHVASLLPEEVVLLLDPEVDELVDADAHIADLLRERIVHACRGRAAIRAA